ncbi:unnamed protein product [Leuciscus chuanchicus]
MERSRKCIVKQQEVSIRWQNAHLRPELGLANTGAVKSLGVKAADCIRALEQRREAGGGNGQNLGLDSGHVAFPTLPHNTLQKWSDADSTICPLAAAHRIYYSTAGAIHYCVMVFGPLRPSSVALQLVLILAGERQDHRSSPPTSPDVP